MQCGKCGKTIDEDCKFCIHCGVKLNGHSNASNTRSINETAQIPKKDCINPKCNQLIDFDSVYCDYCGAKQSITDYAKGDLESFVKEDKWGLKDCKSREVIVPPTYDYIGKFYDNRAVVKKFNKYSYIDINGKELTTFKYEHAHNFSEGVARVKRDGKWAFINTECEQITPFKYENTKDFENGVALVELDGKKSIVNKKGEEIIVFQYSQITEFTPKMYKVRSKNGFGLINIEGEEILPCEYTYIDDINNGLAKISIANLHGFINETGEVIIECIYNKAYLFDNQAIFTRLKNNWTCFDRFGNNISETNPSFIRFFETQKRKRVLNQLLITFVILTSVLSMIILIDFQSNKIGIIRMVQTWAHGADEMEWRDAVSKASIDDISPIMSYLAKYPEGRYVSQAREKIEALEWQKAVTLNTIESYTSYLEKHPEGKMIADAIEIIAWKSAEENHTILVYRDYLANYPHGQYVEVAHKNIEQLIWDETTINDNIYDFVNYLDNYPNGLFTNEARLIVLKKESEEREVESWRLALSVNSIQSYIDFLTQYPTGRFSTDALEKLNYKTICEKCNGNGKCNKCRGTGKFGKEQKELFDWCPNRMKVFHGKNCKICGGDGKINKRHQWVDSKCPDCHNGLCRSCEGTGNIQIIWLTEWYAKREGKILCSNCNGSGGCRLCNGSGLGNKQRRVIGDPCPIKQTGSHANCTYCGGNGIIRERYDYYYDRCTACNGKGKCYMCDGAGLILSTR